MTQTKKSDNLYGEDWLIKNIERRLFLALCDTRTKGKKLINLALKDLEELKKLIAKRQ